MASGFWGPVLPCDAVSAVFPECTLARPPPCTSTLVHLISPPACASAPQRLRVAHYGVAQFQLPCITSPCSREPRAVLSSRLPLLKSLHWAEAHLSMGPLHLPRFLPLPCSCELFHLSPVSECLSSRDSLIWMLGTRRSSDFRQGCSTCPSFSSHLKKPKAVAQVLPG